MGITCVSMQESFPDVMRWMGRRHCDAPHMQIGLWGEMIAAHAAIGLLTSVCLTEQGQSSEGSRSVSVLWSQL